jgi:hypothetical protein
MGTAETSAASRAALPAADHYWLCLGDFGDLGVIRSVADFQVLDASAGPRLRTVSMWRKSTRELRNCLTIRSRGLPQDTSPAKQKTPVPIVIREPEFFYLAVTVGFEPTLAFTPNNISSVAPSAARTRHQPQ